MLVDGEYLKDEWGSVSEIDHPMKCNLASIGLARIHQSLIYHPGLYDDRDIIADVDDMYEFLQETICMGWDRISPMGAIRQRVTEETC